MVRRNLKSYGLLSVTIVLSFSLLLGYLTFVDSLSFNRYKEVFSQDRSLVFSVADTDAYRDRILREKASGIGMTNSLLIHTVHGLRLTIPNAELETGERMVDFGSPTLMLLPAHAPVIYEPETSKSYTFDEMKVTWLDGNAHADMHLTPDEIVIDEALYTAVGSVNGGRLHVILHTQEDNSPLLDAAFRIVGTVPYRGEMSIEIGSGAMEGKATLSGTYQHMLILSNEATNVSDFAMASCTSLVAFVTDQPESIAKLIESLNPNNAPIGAYKAQDRANEMMKTENRQKALICCAMLIVLGINLYSCFENALNARRFEIGVKRAIGASSFRIVRQFFLEGLIVMIVNIALSVAIVTDVFIVYKYIYERMPNEFGQVFQWTVWVSPHSIAMFTICTVTLTLVFSLLFAYRSTRVQIADQLKAE